MSATTSLVQLDASVIGFLNTPKKLLIDGRWVEAASGKSFATYNPATGEVLARVAEGEAEDIDRAVKAARCAFDSGRAIFFNHGQCCTAGSRLLVEHSIFDQVVEGVAAEAKKIRLGPGLHPDTDMGPLVSEEQLGRVCGYLDSGFAEGARAATGGKKVDGPGYFVQPTVLIDTQPNMKVLREEIFGPVVAAIPFDDPETVLTNANDSIYGLAAGVWTSDVRKAHLVASKLRAGTVWINCYNVFDAALPFGGYKQSGWGREMGKEVLDLYTHVKSVCMAL